MSCVRQLVEGVDDKKQILNYSNARNESIYHYLRTMEVCQCFKKELGVSFNAKTWSMKDVDGITPFMKAMAAPGTHLKMEFMEWILAECCKNDEERLKLIYQCDKLASVSPRHSGSIHPKSTA